MPRSRKHRSIHSLLICLHGVVLNYLSTGTTLPFSPLFPKIEKVDTHPIHSVLWTSPPVPANATMQSCIATKRHHRNVYDVKHRKSSSGVKIGATETMRGTVFCATCSKPSPLSTAEFFCNPAWPMSTEAKCLYQQRRFSPPILVWGEWLYDWRGIQELLWWGERKGMRVMWRVSTHGLRGLTKVFTFPISLEFWEYRCNF
jgi:hypothetical protein